MTNKWTSNTRSGQPRRPLALGLAIGLCAVGGCDINDNGLNETPPPQARPLTLQLLHAADQEGGVEAVDDAPRFSAVLDALRALNPDRTLVLSSGDNYIPGPFLAAGGERTEELDRLLVRPRPGRADIAIHNAMGFDASAFGNHEFDLGTGLIEDLIGQEDRGEDGIYPGTAFPYLSCNLDFSAEGDLSGFVVENGLNVNEIPNSIAGSAVAEVLGQQVGIVGATTPILGSISSPGSNIVISPADATDRAALAASIQGCVDELTAAGINKIILLAHMQQISIEEELAPLLSDVDIIVAGGSNTILADDNDRLRAGDTAGGEYPRQFTSASNEPVLVVNTDGNYRYVGRLVVEFDESGVINLDSLDPEVNGAYATDEQGVTDLEAEVRAGVGDVATAIGDIITTLDGNTFGKSDVYINGTRGSVRTEETNLGNLTADANFDLARRFDATVVASIKNAGGIRADVGVAIAPPGSNDPDDIEFLPPLANPSAGKEAGEVSQLDIQNALRFNNSLVLITLNATELKATLEHVVSGSEPGATPGEFAQVGRIRFSFDPALASGSRVRNVGIVGDDGMLSDTVVQDGAIVGDANRTFRIVTLGFLASCDPDCGDNYPWGSLTAANLVELEDEDADRLGVEFSAVGTEQHALALFMLENFDSANPFDVADTPAADDERIQNLSVRATDTVLTP